MDQSFERKRLEAEVRKLELEGDEIQERLNKSFFKSPKRILEVIVAVVVGIVAAGSYIGHIKPVMDVQQKVASLHTEVSLKQAELIRLENSRLKSEIEKLQKENSELRGNVTLK